MMVLQYGASDQKHLENATNAQALAELMAEGEMTLEGALRENNSAAWTVFAEHADDAARGMADTPRRTRLGADLLREIVGNPFQPVSVSSTHSWLTPEVVSMAKAAYEEASIACLHCWASGDERKFKHGGSFYRCKHCRGRGWIDRDFDRNNERLAILSDALEEAGCDNEAMLRHLRGEEPYLVETKSGDLSTGKVEIFTETKWRPMHKNLHVRGCWVLSTILGKHNGPPCKPRETVFDGD
jgi:hypothetical protein